jgi:hypothetical protein
LHRLEGSLKRRQRCPHLLRRCTAADIDPVIAARVMTWDGNGVIARHVASGEESLDAAMARELALIRWHGVYRPAGRPPVITVADTSGVIAASDRNALVLRPTTPRTGCGWMT